MKLLFRYGIITFVTILFLGCVLMDASVEAYYSPFPDQEAQIGFTRNSKAKEFGPKNNFLVCYNNPDPPRKKSSNEAILFPYSKYFVPADIIDFNLSIFPLSHGKSESGRNLDNILYANMKIHLLVEDYKQLRKKSRALLEDLDTPYMENNKKSGFEGKGDWEIKRRSRQKLLEENSDSSIAAVLEELKKQARDAARMSNRREIEDAETEIHPELNDGYLIAFPNSGNKKGDSRSRGSGKYSGTGNRSLKPPAGMASRNVSGRDYGLKRKGRKDWEPSPPDANPWILVVAFNVLNYLLANPMKSMISMFGVYILIAILFKRG